MGLSVSRLLSGLFGKKEMRAYPVSAERLVYMPAIDWRHRQAYVQRTGHCMWLVHRHTESTISALQAF